VTGNSKIFVDTSAFYALLDRSEENHKAAAALWPNLLDINITLLTTNYVVSETTALLQNRIGFEAANLWWKDILGTLDVLWIDSETHERGFALWLNLGRRGLSCFDCVSFVTMYQHEIEKAFCFKPHFTDHGFELLTISLSSDQ
jgi:predicted nucleic acid-binding protein